jgi:hypothetical protein
MHDVTLIPYVNFSFQVLKEAAVNNYKSASNIVEDWGHINLGRIN